MSAAQQQENKNSKVKTADEALDSASARIAERQFQRNMEKGVQMPILKNIVEKKLNSSATADSQKETNVPPVEEKKPAKEPEEQMSAYKQFLVKDIEETKQEQKESLQQKLEEA